MKVRFGVHPVDSSEVFCEIGTPDQPHFRLTFQRNGMLKAVEHIEPEPAEDAAPPAPVTGATGGTNVGDQGAAGRPEGPVG